MGITAQGIKTAQTGDTRAFRNYLFITPIDKTNTKKEPKFDFFANANLLKENQGANNRFMSSMNPFLA